MIHGEILKIIHFYYFDSDPRFPPFYYMLGGNLGSLLYGDVAMMEKKETHNNNPKTPLTHVHI